MQSLHDKLVSIAVLKAKPDRRDQLRDALLALIEPTRQEKGNLDYVLFEAKDRPGVFYMREAFDDQAALDAHFATPHFQEFKARLDHLLQEPIELIFLNQVSD